MDNQKTYVEVFTASPYSGLEGYDGGEDKIITNMTRVATLTLAGNSAKQIAAETGIALRAINEIRRSQEFTDLCNQLTAQIVTTSRTMLGIAAQEAVNVIVAGLRSENEKTRISCANTVLDRIGVKAVSQIELTTREDSMSHLSDKELLDLVKRGVDDIYRHDAVDVEAMDSE